MAVDFFFDPCGFSIPSLQGLRQKWKSIPDPKIIEAVAVEDQYLAFQLYILKSTKFTEFGKLASKPYVYQLGHSVRSGAIKSALLLCASITEAVLRAHAERRGYRLNPNPNKRTFGNVISSWDSTAARRVDVAAVWSDVKSLRDVRNNIHLFKAAADPNATHANVVKQEFQLLAGAQKVVMHMSTLVSP
jgi:hypothetical protein